jgi:hypothetical protein
MSKSEFLMVESKFLLVKSKFVMVKLKVLMAKTKVEVVRANQVVGEQDTVRNGVRAWWHSPTSRDKTGQG